MSDPAQFPLLVAAGGGALAAATLILAGRSGRVGDSRAACLAALLFKTAFAVAAFAAVVQQDFTAAGASAASPSAYPGANSGVHVPTVYNPVVRDSHLKHVKETFVNAGYKIVKNATVDEWDVMWTFHSPFSLREGQPDITTDLQSLKPHQKVNQIPGAAHFTSKAELAKAADLFPFMPRTFMLPAEYDKFQQYYQEHPDSKWLFKSDKHRGVRRVDPSTLDMDLLIGNVLLQETVADPFLVDGKFFDIGFYVAVTSINPLRIYVYDDALIRAAPIDYEEGVDADVDSYVVAEDYMPPWQMPSLRPYYVWGMTTLNVFKAYLSDNGHNPRDMMSNVAQLIAETLTHYQPQLINAAKRYPNGSKNFFALYRVDLILDKQLEPHIIEINQSPNLSSAHFKDLATMFRKVSNAVVRLNGIHRGGLYHPDTPNDLENLMLHTGHIDIGYDVCGQCRDTCEGRCIVCRRCRVPAQSQMLKEAMQEHANQEGFLRIYPPTQRFPEIRKLKPFTNNDKMLQYWTELKCREDPTWC